jgi:rhamnose utilization protein RhaD (predicted bifunctional aldolase and dehydrogenase)
MTNTLGQPQRQYVIIGEGNTSCRVDDETFWIKASGQQMETLGESGFVRARFDRTLELLAQPPQTQTEQKERILATKHDLLTHGMPSIEVSFHAMLLHECGVNVIGHTHPIAVNRILCSTRARDLTRRIFPDEAVLCGPESAFVPYADPGIPLALAIRDSTRVYMDKHSEAPKVILLQNHGMIALGATCTEVLNITAMCVKAADILMGTYAVGEPVFMSDADILHIYRRPDEIYRRAGFVQTLETTYGS